MQRRVREEPEREAEVPKDNSKAKSKRQAAPKTIVLALACFVVTMLFFAGIAALPPKEAIKSRTSEANRAHKVQRRPIPLHKERHSDASENVDYQIIFSTGCSVYQDWQSFVFFYFAWKNGQPGTVTRIVSGCSEEEEANLRKVFDEQIKPMSPDAFKIHFTPDFAKSLRPGHNYPYFNKPLGTKHWLENAMGYPENPIITDSIVVLMDPDQIIMRPFKNNDFSNTLWRFLEAGETPRVRVEHGYPMGQLYGFGLQWLDDVHLDYVFPNETSPIAKMSRNEARKGYIVGPPYIATASDMYAISSKWSEVVARVHDEYPYLLAEMFAYCLAAAHLKLSHQTATSFMISAPATNLAEGWKYIDDIPDNQICDKDIDREKLPNVLHFCQRYFWGPFFFGKHRLPENFFSCEMPLLHEPPKDLLDQYTIAKLPNDLPREMSRKQAKHHVFVLCYIIPAVNEATTYFKQHHCRAGDANYDKKLVFIPDFGSDFYLSK